MTTKIRVNDIATGGVSRYGNPDDRWDGDDTWVDHAIDSISVVETYGDLEVGFDINRDQIYYLLYAIYSTGDSFSSREGEIEYVGLYQDEDVANENLKRIERHHDTHEKINRRSYHLTERQKKEIKRLSKNFSEHTIMLVTEDEVEYQIHVPWHGYFERLTEVTVKRVLVS